MKPSIALEANHEKLRRIAATFRVANLRVFGSVLHGYDKDGSDLDLLVDPLLGTTLFDLEETLGIPVDICTPNDLPRKFREQILAEAKPV